MGFFCIFLFTTTTVSAYDDYYAWFCFEKPDQEIDQFQIRIATSRDEIEKGAEGSLYYEEVIAENEIIMNGAHCCCAILVTSELYGGFYFAVSAISDNIESEPEITPYKPGNILGTPDDAIPPLCFQLSVEYDDIMSIRGNLYASVLDPENESANVLERMDFNNDNTVTSMDYSFAMYQYRFFSKMDN